MLFLAKSGGELWQSVSIWQSCAQYTNGIFSSYSGKFGSARGRRCEDVCGGCDAGCRCHFCSNSLSLGRVVQRRTERWSCSKSTTVDWHIRMTGRCVSPSSASCASSRVDSSRRSSVSINQLVINFYRAVYAVIACLSVCLSIRLSVISRCCMERTGRIELVFGMEAFFHVSHAVL